MDYVTNTYSFVGELLTSKREHKASTNVNATVTTLLTKNEYDHVGRLVNIKHKVNSQDTVLLANNEYNEIGQLKGKKQHSENNGTSFINSTTYSYNERGWTIKAVSSHFTYELKYNMGTVPQYNGNISQQLWGHGTTSTPNVYSYTYDKLNRLLTETSTGTVMSEVLTYDDMGNIKTLKRDNGTTVAYNYTVNSVASNRLQSLTGGLTGTYTYDANGNATTDRTGMTFTYNHLNLPKTATKSGTSVTYVYDATGAKLRKTATVSSTTTVRDYVGGIEYSKVGTGVQAIEMIHTPEGYLRNNNGTYTYHYNLTDHLGNVRATLQRASATTGTIIQKHDYYPFGKSKAIAASGINKYLYNGKEVQLELGDQQDYGARFYDSEIGRWNVIDPLAEDFENFTPYNNGVNNPIFMIDPDGMSSEGFYTRYVRPDGSTIINTNDGKTDVVVVPTNMMADFMHDLNRSKDALDRGEVPTWNDTWRNRLGIKFSEGRLNAEGHYLLESEDAKAAQVKYMITHSAEDWRAFVRQRIRSSWNFANIMAAVSATGSLISQRVQFRKVPNQLAHAERHLLKSGLNVEAVQNAIRKDLAPNIFYQAGVRIEGTVVVDNVVIKYSGVKLPNGKINIGSIKPPK